MSSRAEASSRKQSRRVAAWIYAVINPIIESLLREQAFLDVGNLTWRSYSGRCEMIRNIQDYVEASQWPNYQTFLAEYSKSPFQVGFREHDNYIKVLNEIATEVFRIFLGPGQFRRAMDNLIATFRSSQGDSGAINTPPDSPDVLWDEIAQHVINNSQTLPSHYVIAKFWNSSGRELLRFRTTTEFEPVLRASNALLEHSRRLSRSLELFRLKLSRDYDVPAAPVPGLSFDE